MTISNDIDKYIKDSLVHGKVSRFAPKTINIFVQQISAPISDTLKADYYNIIQQAVTIWNNYAPIQFNFVSNPQLAQVIINWSKVGIKFEGMCKFSSIISSEFRKVSIEIGLPNINSQKTVNNSTILHTVLHELGHAMGLGHGIDENDLMFVPHSKTLSSPSENDLYVLKILYSNPIGTNFENMLK